MPRDGTGPLEHPAKDLIEALQAPLQVLSELPEPASGAHAWIQGPDVVPVPSDGAFRRVDTRWRSALDQRQVLLLLILADSCLVVQVKMYTECLSSCLLETVDSLLYERSLMRNSDSEGLHGHA